MNKKAQVFTTIHQEILNFTALKTSLGRSNRESSGLVQTLLDITHLYIDESGDDETTYWHCFVFDTCCKVGMCEEGYISYLKDEEKCEYIKNLYLLRANQSELKEVLTREMISHKIYSIASGVAMLTPGESSYPKKVVNMFLDFLQTLIAIDRQLSCGEQQLFKEVRDCVFSKFDWKRYLAHADNAVSSVDNGCAHIKSQQRSPEQILKDIEQLIGLSNIKLEVASLINSIEVNRLRKSAGLAGVETSNHMVFYGNPGTGKTTIARKLGELYLSLGLLSKGHFTETDRSGLVAGYLGQTAIKTKEVLDSALGGILFIDEAYSLSSSESNDQFGKEAIDTLLKYMEDHREDLIVIVAGYEDLMGEFLHSNPGLESRFNKYFFFQDYEPEELTAIFNLIAQNSNYSLNEKTRNHVLAIATRLVSNKSENFGNGRTIRNLFEKSIANQANRIIANDLSAKSDLELLYAEDILWSDIEESMGVAS